MPFSTGRGPPGTTRGTSLSRRVLRSPCGSTSLRSVVGSTPIRYYGVLCRCASSFLLSPGMIFRCPPRVFSLLRASRIFASFSLLLLQGVPEAHLEGHGIPIMVVEEVIEIFMVSSASRNFDATDIHWSCVIIYQHFFTCLLSLSSGESAKKKEASDAAREKPQRFDRE